MFQSQIRVLSESDLELIHGSALEVLRDVGVRVDHERMRALLADQGCRVEGAVVKSPERIVEDLVARMRDPASPKSTYTDTLPVSRECMEGKGNRIVPIASAQAIMAHDLDTDEIRPATRHDLAEASQLVAALPEAVAAHPVYIPQDVPEMVRDLYALITVAENYPRSDFVEIYSPQLVPYFLEVGRVIRGSDETLKENPPFCSWAFVTPPLQFGRHGFDIIFQLKDFGMKRGYGVGGVMPILGASTPVTLAGYLVMQTAEVLACNLMNWILTEQLIGYAAGPAMLDMQQMASAQSGPEVTLLFLACMDLQRYYGERYLTFPFALTSDAKFPGIQSGIEKAYKAALAMAAECRLFGAGIGVLCGAQVASMAQMVIDYEMCQMLNHVLEGFEVTEETIGLEMIKRVGIGGSFLGEPHTVRYMRQELFFPELFDRRALGKWLKDRKDMLDYAKNKVRRILQDTPAPEYLTPEQIEEVEKITKKAEMEFSPT